MPIATELLLEAKAISKQFSGVPVLREVNFDLRAGEVHALLGGNGAGKSTLMHIIAGVFPADTGELRLEGKPVRFRDPEDAHRAGVCMVFQELSLAGPLSVEENVFFARQPVKRFGIIDGARLRSRTRGLLDQLGVDIDPGAIVADLAPSQQQMVEIAKALSWNARVFIFDEPTSALSHEETEHLFEVIGRLRARGAGIVYISHRLAEILRVADRVTVLKDGRVEGTIPASDATTGGLIALMSGGAGAATAPAIGVAPTGTPRLEVQGLSDRSLLRNLSFTARAGEIVALAGLSGAGRTETALALFGARPRTSGRILIDGAEVPCASPIDAMRRGIGYLPEDRKLAGLFLDMDIGANIAAADLGRFGSFWFDTSAIRTAATEYCRSLRVACTEVSQRVAELSGGNQQKVALAKWLLREPSILIADEPTRGVDVAAKAEVHQLLRDLAASGTAVILISSELPEVLNVADRIYVMHAGSITGELSRAQASEDAILHLATLSEAPHS
jgi:ribose transport system ATP-binding protein